MNPNILSGHGALVVGDASPVLRVPLGTSVPVWTEHGNTISDLLGNAIETGEGFRLNNFLKRLVLERICLEAICQTTLCTLRPGLTCRWIF